MAIAAAVRVEMYVKDKDVITHDESLTVLYSAGHIKAFYDAQEKYLGRWVPATTFKVFSEVGEWKSPVAIATELGVYGNHPPFYFWVAHVWGHAFGIQTLRALNVVLVLCSAVALYFFARARFGAALPAALTVAAWSLNPEVIRVSAHARSYELLTLIVILFASQSLRIIERPGRIPILDYGLLAALAAIGILTHYYMILVLLTAALAILIYRKERILPYAAVAAVAALVFFALHPNFYHVAGHGEVFDDISSADHAWLRITRIASTWLGFYGWRPSWTTAPVALAVLGLSIAGFVALAMYVFRRKEHGAALCFLLFPAAAIEFFFIFRIVPIHGEMSARYLAIVWPFFVFLHIMVINRYLPRLRMPIMAGVCFLFGPAMLWVAMQRGESPLPGLIAGAHRIVLNNVTPGTLPRYLKHARDDAQVFALEKADLLTNAEAWVGKLAPGDILILNLGDKDRKEKEREYVLKVGTDHKTKVLFSRFATTVLAVR